MESALSLEKKMCPILTAAKSVRLGDVYHEVWYVPCMGEDCAWYKQCSKYF